MCGLSADQNVHSTAQSPTNGIMGTHPIQAPCSVVDTYCKDIAEDTYKAHGGALTTLDFGVGEPQGLVSLEERGSEAFDGLQGM